MIRKRVEALIDRCAEICGSQNKLAERLGMRSGTMSDYRTGKRAMTAPLLAEIAEIARISGEECRELLALIECDKQPDPRKAEVMRRSFFACLVAGVGFAWTPSNAQAIEAGYPIGQGLSDTLYIVRSCWALVWTWARPRARNLRARFRPRTTAFQCRAGGLSAC